MAALVTGAGRGIGFELARELCSRGYLVLAVVRSMADVERLPAELGDSVQVLCCDITDKSAERLIREFLELKLRGKLKLLINNAGYGASKYGIEDLSFEELESVLAVHLHGAIRCVRAALPYLKKASPATVINISSRFASCKWVASLHLSPSEATYAYRIGKAAMNMLSACLSAEFSAEELKVLAVDPGKVKTRFGPKDADTEAADAARSILTLALNNSHTGKFVNSAGDELPW